MSSISDRLSLSTCWCSGRHDDGYAMVEEMVHLGFKHIELSHGIRLSLVPGILKAVEENLVQISSVHNFCPLPHSIYYPAPNLYEPSTSNYREAALWGRYTKQTLDFALKVGASKVVMHSGSLRYFFNSPEKRLKKWISANNMAHSDLLGNDKFKKRLDSAMKRVKKASKAAIERVLNRYEQVLPWAKERNLKLCLENREGIEEMPVDANFKDLMDELSASGQVAYWHDTGHAQIKHGLGLLDHRAHLTAMKNHLAGFHLHDVTEDGMDHQVPGSGTVDFQMIAEFVRPEHALVLELNPRLSSDDVLASRDYIAHVFA